MTKNIVYTVILFTLPAIGCNERTETPLSDPNYICNDIPAPLELSSWEESYNRRESCAYEFCNAGLEYSEDGVSVSVCEYYLLTYCDSDHDPSNKCLAHCIVEVDDNQWGLPDCDFV